jgi:hypothetical protein
MRLFEDGTGELGMKGIESPCLLVFMAATTSVRDETERLFENDKIVRDSRQELRRSISGDGETT